MTALDLEGLPLTPDIIIPSQFYRSLRVSRTRREGRLQLAVLDDAVATLRRCVGSEEPEDRRLLADVDEWFASDDTKWPFAFVTVCHTLGLDPVYVRRRLRRWRARSTATERTPPRQHQSMPPPLRRTA